MFLVHLLPLALMVLGGTRHVYAKAVFAHFMVSNAANYSVEDWEDDIQKAQDAHITAFALNMAYNEGTDSMSIARAFVAAENKGFELFFSFDYAGRGPWPKALVMSTVGAYMNGASYYRYSGRPFVSTFEGWENAEDWHDIKEVTGCFFVPDWSSLGAKAAIETAGGVADGLFSWAAWPWGPQDMDTYVDASYLQYLNGKPYMMPVSPWFYTNLPEWKKNWLWGGDNLWFDRWQEVLYVQPEWVQIISWNDYGESHYIGPIRSNALSALRSAPFDFVTGMPHDAWRVFLPFSIDVYVKNTTEITKEGITFWYRPNPTSACGTGQTTGNTASQLQLEFPAAQVMGDAVFYTALLGSDATVTVSIGGSATTGKWRDTPDGGAGLYHGNVTFNGRTGPVTVSLSRGGTVFATSSGTPITSSCTLVNWNAWVGQALSGGSVSKKPSMDGKVCIRGTGARDFAGLCSYACSLGYCPTGACLCQAMGTQKTKPPYTGVAGFPAAGKSANYWGLCSFNCNLGYCPPSACGTVEVPLAVETVSPFLPPTCTKGHGPAGSSFEGLCSYACNFGYCPSNICTCDLTGALNAPPPVIRDTVGFPVDPTLNDYGLCDFACRRGYCPPGSCNQRPRIGGGEPAYIDPTIWTNPEPVPVVGCSPPCVVVLPPYTLPTPTTISCSPLTTTITENWAVGVKSTKVTTIPFQPITTDRIPVFNLNITHGNVNSVTFAVTPSLFCVAKVTVAPPLGITTHPYGHNTTAMTYYITLTPPPTTIWPPVTSSKSKVSFTSTSSAVPTCKSGCGDQCRGHGCNDCDGSGCSCQGCCNGCCNGCSGGGGGSGEDRGCWGWACPPGTGPRVGGGGGGAGDPGSDPNDPNDPSCTAAESTATHTTVHCELSASPGKLTMETTCTSTGYSTVTGCNLRPTTTTTYTSYNCPTYPAYVPPWSVYTADLPTAGDKGWGGFVFATGTYTSASSPPSSGTPTTPSSTPNPNVRPLTRGPINCFDKADFPGHADIQSGDQDRFSTEFSNLRGEMGDDDTIGPGDAPIRFRRTDSHGVNYDYRVQWAAGCVTTVQRQSFGFPLGMSQSLITAYLLVREGYTKCNNGGIGGTCQAGCLLYTFEGGRGDEGTDPCDDFDCRQCGTPFDPPGCQSCCRGFRLAAAMSPHASTASNHSHYVVGEKGAIVIDDLK